MSGKGQAKLPGCDGEQFITMYCGHCGYEITPVVSCGFRTCPHCRRRMYQRLKAKYAPLVKKIPRKNLALVTLTTLVARDQPLGKKLEKLRSDFGRLRRREIWEAVVSGGFYSIEVKWSRAAEGWNVHVHALVESRHPVHRFGARCTLCGGTGESGGRACVRCRGSGSIRQCDLIGEGSRMSTWDLDSIWHDITGDSRITNIMPVRADRGGGQGAVSYLLKYLSKDADMGPTRGRGERAVEYNDALGGVRVVHAFGTWHAAHSDYRFKRDRTDLSECPECGALESWISEFEMRRMKKNAIPPSAGGVSPLPYEVGPVQLRIPAV